jgi:hypothetical protein
MPSTKIKRERRYADTNRKMTKQKAAKDRQLRQAVKYRVDTQDRHVYNHSGRSQTYSRLVP